MNFSDYQKQALTTSRPVDSKDEIYHLLLALMGEAGEIAEKAKKIVRDHDADFTKLDRGDIAKELGDVMWYVAVLANYFGIDLDDVAAKNVAKLQDRKARDVLSGSGDDR